MDKKNQTIDLTHLPAAGQDAIAQESERRAGAIESALLTSVERDNDLIRIVERLCQLTENNVVVMRHHTEKMQEHANRITQVITVMENNIIATEKLTVTISALMAAVAKDHE